MHDEFLNRLISVLQQWRGKWDPAGLDKRIAEHEDRIVRDELANSMRVPPGRARLSKKPRKPSRG